MIISRKDFKTMCKTMDEIVKKNNEVLSLLGNVVEFNKNLVDNSKILANKNIEVIDFARAIQITNEDLIKENQSLRKENTALAQQLNNLCRGKKHEY